MFSTKSSDSNINIASNGAVAATTVNAPVSIQNISTRLCRKDEILKRTFDSNPEAWTYSDEEGFFYHSSDIYLQIRESRSDILTPFNEPWVKSYADPNAYRAIFFISYDNTEIAKYYFASVDGSKMFIPYPKASADLRITRNQYLLGKIINYPWEQYGYNFDEYLQRAGIIVDKNL